MTHQYTIKGMTCTSCVAKAKSALLMLGDVTEANVQLAAPQATISMQQHIPVSVLQNALSKAGNYTIEAVPERQAVHTSGHEAQADDRSWLETYKPILLIGAYILGGSLLVEWGQHAFVTDSWMANFMAVFFLTFSFFKLLDIKGFADSYSTYDVLARRWHGWGSIYPFVELLLGVAYLVRFNPILTNGVTFVVMMVSIIGVLQSVLSKRTIRCACLGAVFNLPMSTITIIEDGLMIVMSAWMLMQTF